MRFYEIISESLDLAFSTHSRASHSGQMDLTLVASREGKPLGKIDYSTYGDEVHIQMIKAFERGKGIGPAMVRQLQLDYPDAEIDWGSLTPDGAKLYAKTPFRDVVDPEVTAMQDRLAAVKRQLAGYQTLADRFDTDPTEVNRLAIIAAGDDWNDLHDEERRLEDELRYARPSRRFIHTGASA